MESRWSSPPHARPLSVSAHPRAVDVVAARRPEVLFVVGAVSQYVGAAVAVGLFDRIAPVGVAWLRALAASVALLAVARWVRARTRGGGVRAGRGTGGGTGGRVAPPPWTRRELTLAAAFGTATVAMNVCFFLAIDRLPLGTAVAIEFIGPIAVAVSATRTRRNAVALVLAGTGVALLSGVELGGEPLGVVFILASAACWAAYILAGRRVAGLERGTEGLAVGLALGTLVWAPVGVASAGGIAGDWGLLLPAAAVGVLSTAVPYGLDQVVLRHLSAGRFAFLLVLLPTTATVVGAVALGQVPGLLACVGIAAVIAALVVQDRPTGMASAAPAPPAPPGTAGTAAA